MLASMKLNIKQVAKVKIMKQDKHETNEDQHNKNEDQNWRSKGTNEDRNDKK